MAEGSLECSRPRAWPNSWTATRKRSLPGQRGSRRGELEGQYRLKTLEAATLPTQLSLL